MIIQFIYFFVQQTIQTRNYIRHGKDYKKLRETIKEIRRRKEHIVFHTECVKCLICYNSFFYTQKLLSPNFGRGKNKMLLTLFQRLLWAYQQIEQNKKTTLLSEIDRRSPTKQLTQMFTTIRTIIIKLLTLKLA